MRYLYTHAGANTRKYKQRGEKVYVYRFIYVYTAQLPATTSTSTATFADDTEIWLRMQTSRKPLPNYKETERLEEWIKTGKLK